jgi:hypothetical protein
MSIYKKKRKRGDLVKDKANAYVIAKQVTFRDLKKRVSLETTQESKNFLRDCTINPFGFGILKKTSKNKKKTV